MHISCLTSSLPQPVDQAIDTLANLGFQWIDVPPTAARREVRARMADLGLQIGCVGLEREMPDDFNLASSHQSQRLRAVDYFRHALDAASTLEAPAAYLTPPVPADDATRSSWSKSLEVLAAHASQVSIDLCIEHFPGRLLPTGAATLAFLDELQLPSLRLLIDVGHCLISQEDPAQLLQNAGDRLGYIHFDDNDGCDDLHWPLLRGKLDDQILRQTIAGLRAQGYQRPLCLELHPELDAPVNNILKSREILLSCL